LRDHKVLEKKQDQEASSRWQRAKEKAGKKKRGGLPLQNGKKDKGPRARKSEKRGGKRNLIGPSGKNGGYGDARRLPEVKKNADTDKLGRCHGNGKGIDFQKK